VCHHPAPLGRAITASAFNDDRDVVAPDRVNEAANRQRADEAMAKKGKEEKDFFSSSLEKAQTLSVRERRRKKKADAFADVQGQRQEFEPVGSREVGKSNVQVEMGCRVCACDNSCVCLRLNNALLANGRRKKIFFLRT
jgi:hypothetical protein